MPDQPVEHYTQAVMVAISGRHSYVHVTVVSPPNPDRAIFLIHDLAGRGEDFSPLAPHLARMGYRVVMCDMPGRGKSAWLDASEYTAQTYAKVLGAVLKAHHLQQNAILGQGWGAMMAVLFGTFVHVSFSRLFLCDLPLQWSYAADNKAQLWAQLSELAAISDAEFLREADALTHSELPGRAAFLKALEARIDAVEGKPRLSIDPAIFAHLEEGRDKSYDLAKALGNVRAPLTLLQGKTADLPLIGRQDVSGSADYVSLDHESDLSWANPALLFPVVGAIYARGEQGAVGGSDLKHPAPLSSRR
ncbi:MAG: alpha/beta fold hydrolase [Pseudomonadota bacterium]